MAQMSLFSRAQTAAMRDWTKARNYDPDRAEFRRQHKIRRDWGLQRRHAEKLRRLRESGIPPRTPADITGIRAHPTPRPTPPPPTAASTPATPVPQHPPVTRSAPARQPAPATRSAPVTRSAPASCPALAASPGVARHPAVRRQPSAASRRAPATRPATAAAPAVSLPAPRAPQPGGPSRRPETNRQPAAATPAPAPVGSVWGCLFMNECGRRRTMVTVTLDEGRDGQVIEGLRAIVGEVSPGFRSVSFGIRQIFRAVSVFHGRSNGIVGRRGILRPLCLFLSWVSWQSRETDCRQFDAGRGVSLVVGVRIWVSALSPAPAGSCGSGWLLEFVGPSP